MPKKGMFEKKATPAQGKEEIVKHVNVMFQADAQGTCKPHVIPKALLKAVLHDLNERGMHEEKIEPTNKAYVDFGGMLMIDTPVVEVKVDGITYMVLASQIDLALIAVNDLLRSEPRVSMGQKYYKLHGAWACWVLSPSNLKHLRHRLKDALKPANLAMREFLLGRRKQGLPSSKQELYDSMAAAGHPIAHEKLIVGA